MQTVYIDSQRRAQRARRSILYMLPAKFKAISLRLQLVLVTSVLLLSLGARTLTAKSPSDPFSAYDAIVPGQPISALDSFKCKMVKERINGETVDGTFFCILFPINERFDIVNVRGKNGIITEVTFYSTDLSLGELILYFGHPTSQKEGIKLIQLNWDGPSYTVEVFTPQMHFENHIRIVVFRSEQKLAPVSKGKV